MGSSGLVMAIASMCAIMLICQMSYVEERIGMVTLPLSTELGRAVKINPVEFFVDRALTIVLFCVKFLWKHWRTPNDAITLNTALERGRNDD